MSKSIQSLKWAIKNYLNKHNIYKDDSNMQTIIINSFYCENGNNEDEWPTKIKYVQEHFGKFAMYAHNNWKKANKLLLDSNPTGTNI